MSLRKRFAPATMALLGLGSFLTGCSGLDDLQITNNYSVALQLRRGQEILGTVATGETHIFSGKGGYRGHALNEITYLDGHGRKLGVLSAKSPNALRCGERFNGSVTWKFTLGPKKEAKFFAF